MPFGVRRAPSQAGAGPATIARMVPRLLALLAVVLLAGCGDETVDTSQVESGIKSDVKAAGSSPSSVKCPGDVKSERGATFECSVTMTNNATGKVKVTQQAGKTFTYQLVPGSVQVPGETAEAEIAKQLDAQGIPNATVNCPDNIIVKLDTSVTCDVAGSNRVGKVTFSWSDSSGTVDESSVEAS
jgi:Domain of unknown function (DUF4333)